jgi:hypothetical protein
VSMNYRLRSLALATRTRDRQRGEGSYVAHGNDLLGSGLHGHKGFVVTVSRSATTLQRPDPALPVVIDPHKAISAVICSAGVKM